MARTHRPLTVVSLLLALFMGAMEMTVVSTAMPTVIGELGGIHLYSWVFTAYMLTSTVTVPIYGKLADLYGRKPVMFFGMGLFLLGSMASGQAHGMGQLIAFRALQGLGAGAMQPTALTIVGDLFNLEERAKMQGLFGAVWGLAGIAGPMLGGFIVKWLSWRWIFYVNVPLGLLSAVLLALALHEKVERHDHPLDFLGAGLLVLALLALLSGSHGGARALWALPAGALLVALFIAVELRAKEPVLPISLFRKPVMAVSSAAGALVGGAMVCTVTFLPLYVQGVLGGSPTDAGSAITPMVIGWPIASALGGRLLTRLGFRPLIRAGMLISAVAAAALAMLLNPAAGLALPRAATALFGVGLGLANTALLIAVQSSVDWKQRGVATASTMFFRTIGGTLAVGVAGGVLAAALGRDSSIPSDAADQLLGPDHGKHLGGAVLHGLSGALQSGIGTILWIVAGMAFVAFVASWLFPRIPMPAATRLAATPAAEGAPADVDVISPES